jgi:hypothetical protein
MFVMTILIMHWAVIILVQLISRIVQELSTSPVIQVHVLIASNVILRVEVELYTDVKVTNVVFAERV